MKMGNYVVKVSFTFIVFFIIVFCLTMQKRKKKQQIIQNHKQLA